MARLRFGKSRSVLYKVARGMGDWNALASGSPRKMAMRVGRRVAGKCTAKGLGKLFK